MTTPHSIENSPASQEELSPGLQALSKGLFALFWGLGGTLLLAIIWYVSAEGLVHVEQGSEYALVMQLGQLTGPNEEVKYYEQTTWTFPYPISKIVKIPRQQQVLKLNTFMGSDEMIFKKTNDQNNHGVQSNVFIPESKMLSIGKDGYLMTGNENILFAEWGIIYRIVDPVQFYLNCGIRENPLEKMIPMEQMMKILTERAIVDVTAAMDSQQIFEQTQVRSAHYSGGKGNYEILVKNRLEQLLQEVKIGIQVERVELQDVSATESVWMAFKLVLESRMLAQTEQIKAEVEAQKKITEAEMEAQKKYSEAAAYRMQRMTDAQAYKAAFCQLLPEYRKNPETLKRTLRSQTLATALSKVKKQFILTRGGKAWIKLNPTPNALDATSRTEGNSTK